MMAAPADGHAHVANAAADGDGAAPQAAAPSTDGSRPGSQLARQALLRIGEDAAMLRQTNRIASAYGVVAHHVNTRPLAGTRHRASNPRPPDVMMAGLCVARPSKPQTARDNEIENWETTRALAAMAFSRKQSRKRKVNW